MKFVAISSLRCGQNRSKNMEYSHPRNYLRTYCTVNAGENFRCAPLLLALIEKERALLETTHESSLGISRFRRWHARLARASLPSAFARILPRLAIDCSRQQCLETSILNKTKGGHLSEKPIRKSQNELPIVYSRRHLIPKRA